MNTYKLIVALLVLIPACHVVTVSQTKQWLSYEPATVELQGRLTIQRKYGPPNYGEDPKTDAKVTVPVLVLTRRVNVRGIPGDVINGTSVRAIRQIQIFFADPETKYKQFLGKRVLVKGTLFHAHTGHHYTDVVMRVTSIEAAP